MIPVISDKKNNMPFNIQDFLSPEKLQTYADFLLSWMQTHLFSLSAALQLAFLTIVFLLSVLFKRLFLKSLNKATRGKFAQHIVRKDSLIRVLVGPAFIFIAVQLALIGLESFQKIPAHVFRLALNLTGAWIVIRLITSFIRSPFWARTAANIAWLVAALNLLGWLGPVEKFLDSLRITVGKTQLSVWMVLKGLLLISIFLFVAILLGRLARNRINAIPDLTPSARILLRQVLQVSFIVFAIILGFSTLGLDLSFFAFIGGAIGVGLGFGLRSIIANFISGVILLLDRSLKPGDVITVVDHDNNTYGVVTSLGLRYSSIVTRDSQEHLIPNETFMTEKVINWSHSSNVVRIKRPIGVAYRTDLRKAQTLAIEACLQVPRVLDRPKPVCLLRGFGDSSVNLEIRFWIKDPRNGVNNVSSEVLLSIWDAFQENGVQFPFPQRDIHVKAGMPLDVRLLDHGQGEQEE